MEQIKRSFGVWDYIVFGGLFVISAGIGVFFALVSRKKQKNSDDYLMGSRRMHAVPVAFSMTAGFLSAITSEFFYDQIVVSCYIRKLLVIVVIVCSLFHTKAQQKQIFSYV